MMTVNLHFSKRGLPCLWEQGGGYSNTGDSRIIGGRGAEPKKPIYVQRRGHLACGEHALIPVRIGDIVVDADHHREDFTIWIFKVVEISKEDGMATLQKINYFSEGEWDKPLAEKFKDMVEAAKDKATDYHCRSAYYIEQ